MFKRGSSDATVREEAMRYLSVDPQVKTNFIRRDEFLGGAISAGGKVDYPTLQHSRKEFAENIFQSDYVLCARGAGNFSYRLYETLCCGRIPVFVNTDCVLPYEDRIDWKQLCVWVEVEELSGIGEKVTQFHRKLSPEEFKALQQKCRKVWLEYLSPRGFFHTLRTQLPEIITPGGR